MKSKEYLIKHNRLTGWLLLPSLLLLISCYGASRDSNSIDLYDYILSAPEYSYTVTKAVKTVASCPYTPLTEGTIWTYYEYYEGEYKTANDTKTLTIKELLGDSAVVITFSEDDYDNDYLDFPWMDTDTLQLVNEFPTTENVLFPRPTQATMPTTPVYIVMDDNTICFRDINGSIFSSHYGLLAMDKSGKYFKEYHTIVQTHELISVPHIIREFTAKERYLAQQ